MRSEPYVSAVVTLGAGDEGDDQPTVQDPEGVASQGAAVLSGGSPAPSVAGRRQADPADVNVPREGSPTARAKGYFTNAGFEVHAPLGATFSIGASRSRFERFFGQALVIDEERLGSPVTTEAGERALSTERLPAEVQDMVESILLPEPPSLPGLG